MADAQTPDQAEAMKNLEQQIEEAMDELKAALDRLQKLRPPPPEPKDPPTIEPRQLASMPGSFHRGYNMFCDVLRCPGKIPVVVIPVRDEDVRRYKRKRTVKALLKALQIV